MVLLDRLEHLDLQDHRVHEETQVLQVPRVQEDNKVFRVMLVFRDTPEQLELQDLLELLDQLDRQV